jgi:hypothetical protein
VILNDHREHSRPGRYRAESKAVLQTGSIVGLLASLRATDKPWRYAKP